MSFNIRGYDEFLTMILDRNTRILELETALRKIMAEADGCGEHNSKEFHRECLNSVRTIAWQALEGK